jgi:hypothetical protein
LIKIFLCQTCYHTLFILTTSTNINSSDCIFSPINSYLSDSLSSLLSGFLQSLQKYSFSAVNLIFRCFYKFIFILTDLRISCKDTNFLATHSLKGRLSLIPQIFPCFHTLISQNKLLNFNRMLVSKNSSLPSLLPL